MFISKRRLRSLIKYEIHRQQALRSTYKEYLLDGETKDSAVSETIGAVEELKLLKMLLNL